MYTCKVHLNFLTSIRKLKKLQKYFYSNHNHFVNPILSFGEDFVAAKEKNLPIVALESTIITHGMPYPDNLSTALEVEDIIRQKGAFPATIAVLNGSIKVGVNKKEIEILAKSDVKNLIKVSRREFPYAVSKGLSGGTTVSGTMLIANKVGISIMATGGIGGVHRQVESSMDISADLKEMGQTPVTVVCSGVKAILDIPKTLEYLESQGVPVATLGPSDKFPAFYSRETFDGIQSPMRLSDAAEASRLILAQRKLALETGILLAVPIPQAFALDPQEIEQAIQEALKVANCKNISGKNVTPFLLAELVKLTAGRSLQSNIALIKNNAEVAAEIALHLNKLQSLDDEYIVKKSTEALKTVKKSPVVIGGSTLDTILRIKESEIKMNGSTYRGESHQSYGGVGRNLAVGLMNLGISDTKLLSVIGNDEYGQAVIDSLGNAASTIRTLSDMGTARYTAIVDTNGNCCFGIGEMDAFFKIDKQYLQSHEDTLKQSSLIVMDGNAPLDAMAYVINVSIQHRIPIWYETTDLPKVLKIFQNGAAWQKTLKFVSPNINELLLIAKYFSISVPSEESDVDIDTIKSISEKLIEWIPVVIATMGPKGVLVTRNSSGDEPFLNKDNTVIENDKVHSRLYSPVSVNKDIANVSGCGDCLAAGIIAGILRGWKESNSILLGLHAAKQSLISHQTVPHTLKLLPVDEEYYSRKNHTSAISAYA
ncbi:uncharacterized protein LOC131668322 [Phymastichus coffea]|uniref:uncharacterized protein LOC131668322 n=1 Tax=Phymastichus coffea TaxID=108790 RepID=UPI00273BBB72|nr:uncharacterized protein LOC131668322 [Phymastichus coffea]